MFRVVLVALLLAGTPPGAHIVAVAPNPTAPGDRGEYVVVEFPAETDLSNWSLDDGETIVKFPNETVQGRIVATTDPDAVENSTDLPVLAVRGHLALANGGETIRLRRGNETVDDVHYNRAPEGQQYVRVDDGWEWRHPGVTDRPVTREADVRARLFVLPDAPDEVMTALQTARERILLGGYTFSSSRVTEELCDARERDVDVRVLVERSPVGGLDERSAARFDELVACDVSVALIGGERSRYAFHHAKYAVIDDRAMVLTENWKPAGTGGRSSRGWGVTVEGGRIARSLAETHAADGGWRDVAPWESVRDDLSVVESDPSLAERYPRRFDPEPTRLDSVEVVAAPDNAEEEIVSALDGAEDSILVEQVSIGSRGLPFVRGLLGAAERGVRVRVLLSAARYVRDDNAAIVSWLNERGSRDGLPIEARLAEPRSRYGKIHAKGVVVDGETVILGSVNWNNASVRENREIAVILHGEEAGQYYASVFRSDWRGGTWRLPAGFVATSVLAWLGSGIFARRIRFEDQ